jgi:hypothetical protein
LLNLTDRTVVLFPHPCTEQIRVDSPTFLGLSDICGKAPLVLPVAAVSFHSVRRRATLRYWVLPRALCPPDSLAVSADGQLDATAENGLQRFPVCVFTQADAAGYQMTITTAGNTNSAVSYYDTGAAPHRCRGPPACEFRATRPFFALIGGRRPEGNFSMTISYRVRAAPAAEARCAVRSLSSVAGGALAFRQPAVGDISVVCLTSAQELRNKVVSLLLTILVTAAVLFVIHCLGVVKLFKLIGCGARQFSEADYLALAVA